MLTALEQGVEGGQWFRLYDKVFAERNLLAGYQQVAKKKGAAGVDHVSTEEFGRAIPENLWQLSDALREGTYRPQAIRRVYIPKPGTTQTRPLAPVRGEEGRRCVTGLFRRRS
jgi:RNA-directed DNA polymerase